VYYGVKVKMGDYFESWFNDCLSGVEECFNAFWTNSEDMIESFLNGFGENLVKGVDAYKNLVVKEYKTAYEKIKDDRAKMAKKINEELNKEPDEKKKQKIKDKLVKTDELKKRREQKLETKKNEQLKKLEKARERRLKKLQSS
jgi:alpha-galactosidase/6-phospho-beta-glucosidase family protein